MPEPRRARTAPRPESTVTSEPPPCVDGVVPAVGGDSRSGVSGLAYEGRSADGDGVSALVVHDDKRPEQPRPSRIAHTEGSTVVTPLVRDGPERGGAARHAVRGVLDVRPVGQPLSDADSRRSYRAAYPTGDGTRHVSDIAVTDSGRILVGSTGTRETAGRSSPR
ncbi:hypothetical protein EDD98_6407 [Streptomyces sp. PanSC19]|uniref:hypothetical protein n=1 Tax=Streptomyces sp. PanSC19 TaxID=1520455 RepID=UPI000F926DC8|nr:hypothetical protein [Streptomyces sp. PanSC19]ROQ26758.1 hypothetical protein EDD98_6407 [Streptomyces sp. PanSC19]